MSFVTALTILLRHGVPGTASALRATRPDPCPTERMEWYGVTELF